jgi:hypothetical protein
MQRYRKSILNIHSLSLGLCVGIALLSAVSLANGLAQTPATPAKPAPSQAPASLSATDPAVSNKPVNATADTQPNSAKPVDTAAKDKSEQNAAKDQLAEDTARLLQLANELKAEMDKSTKDTLSLSVMKKADEIEKLAKKVRAEMKSDIGN